MRFVSKSAGLSAGNFRNAKEAIAPPETKLIDGKTVTSVSDAYTITPALPIQFSQLGLLQSDIDAAFAQWKKFPGLPVEDDGITPVNPVEHGYVGVWDSEAWQTQHALPDEDREAAEQLLLQSRYLGIDFIVVEAVKVAKPWPSYDTTHHNKIPALASELGLIVEALAYEQENKQRASVIEQLEAALAQAEAGEFVSA